MIHLALVADHGQMTMTITKASGLLGKDLSETLPLDLIQIAVLIFEDSRPPEADQVEVDAGRGLIPEQQHAVATAQIAEALASIDLLTEMLGAGVPQSLKMKGSIVLDDPGRKIVRTIITALDLERG